MFPSWNRPTVSQAEKPPQPPKHEPSPAQPKIPQLRPAPKEDEMRREQERLALAQKIRAEQLRDEEETPFYWGS